MADSTLDPDNIPAGADRTLGRGHGTRALGPSDNSDSGSDVVGEPDLGLDSDTDAQGTGERAGVDDANVAAADLGYDHVEAMPSGDDESDDDLPDPVDGDVEQDVPPQTPREDRRDWSRTN